MNTHTRFRVRTVVLAAACSCAAFAARAQVPENQQEPVPPETVTPLPPEAAPPTEQQLDRFADAFLVIEEIHAQAAAQLENAHDPATANQIKAKAEGEILKAVESSGLKLDEFNEIAELMVADLALRQKIADKVDKRRRI